MARKDPMKINELRNYYHLFSNMYSVTLCRSKKSLNKPKYSSSPSPTPQRRHSSRSSGGAHQTPLPDQQALFFQQQSHHQSAGGAGPMWGGGAGGHATGAWYGREMGRRSPGRRSSPRRSPGRWVFGFVYVSLRVLYQHVATVESLREVF